MPPDFHPAEMRLARKRLGLTQERMADALGMTRGTVIRIEQGEKAPRHPTLLRLALRCLLRDAGAVENVMQRSP